MIIDTARQAGQLAAQIDAIDAEIASLQQLKQNGAILIGSTDAQDPVSGKQFPVAFSAMTAAESGQMFDTAIAILQARLAVLQQQLAAL